LQKIADLPNLGPKSQAMLANAGLHTVEQIRALGSVASYLAVKRFNKSASLNLLWALEGAINGKHWQNVAKHQRLELLTQIELAKETINSDTAAER
jgi:DNA transformation protein